LILVVRKKNEHSLAALSEIPLGFFSAPKKCRTRDRDIYTFNQYHLLLGYRPENFEIN
jgi:hypothetical protein